MTSEKHKKVLRIYNGIRLSVLLFLVIIAIVLALKERNVKSSNDTRLIQKTDTIILDH